MYRGYYGMGEAPAVPSQVPVEEGSEQPKKYIFKKSLAAAGNAGDSFPDLQQFIDKNADFIWLAKSSISTGNFSVNFKDHGGRDLFSSPAQAANVLGTGQFPVEWENGLFYPAGSRISISLTNLHNAQNDIELCLIGIARYRSRG